MVVFVELFFVQKDIGMAVGTREQQTAFFTKLWIFTLALVVYSMLSLYFFYNGLGSMIFEIVRVKVFKGHPTIDVPVKENEPSESQLAPSLRIAPRIGTSFTQSGFRPAGNTNPQLMSTTHRIQYISGTNLPNTFGRVTNQVEIQARVNPTNDYQTSSYMPASFMPESQVSHPYIQNPATYNAVRFERHSQDSGTNLDAFGMNPATEQRPVGQHNPNTSTSITAPRARAFISSAGRDIKPNPFGPIFLCRVPFCQITLMHSLFFIDGVCGIICQSCVVVLLSTHEYTTGLLAGICVAALWAAGLALSSTLTIPKKLQLNEDEYKREIIDIEDEERSAESKEERIITITVPRFLVKLASDYYRIPDNYDLLKFALDPATTGRPISSKPMKSEDLDLDVRPLDAERDSKGGASNGPKDMVGSKRQVLTIPKESNRKRPETQPTPREEENVTATSVMDGRGPPGGRKVYLFQVHSTKFKSSSGQQHLGLQAKSPRHTHAERLSPLIQDSNNMSPDDDAGLSEPPEVSLRRQTHSQTIRTDKPELSKGETQQASDKDLCFVCFDGGQTGVNMPCGHGGVCVGCAVEMWGKGAVCHLCKGAVECLLHIDPFPVASIVKVLFVYVIDQGKGAGLGLVPPGSEGGERGSAALNRGEEIDNASLVAQDQRRRGNLPRRQPI